MDLRPTPTSHRIAIITAIGAGVIMVAAAALTLDNLWFAFGFAAALATFIPAVGAISARVSVDDDGVRVRRFGHTRRYGWHEIGAIGVVERRANVPDGTEYHWIFPNRRTHMVAVPYLECANGGARQLPALASPAAEHDSRPADDYAVELRRYQSPARSR